MSIFSNKYDKNSQGDINNYVHRNINLKSKMVIRNYLLKNGAKHGQVDVAFESVTDVNHAQKKQDSNQYVKQKKHNTPKIHRQSNSNTSNQTHSNPIKPESFQIYLDQTSLSSDNKKVIENFEGLPQMQQFGKIIRMLVIIFMIFSFGIPLFMVAVGFLIEFLM